MKTCPECGGAFKNLGVHMRKHRREKDALQERVQKADEKADTRPQRPLERFNNRVVFQGQCGVIRK